MPGSVIANMPPQDDDQQRRIRDAERQAREQASAKSGQAMQIGAGGITVTNGGSITIQGTGSLNVGSGALNSAGSITAATTITAAGNVQGGGLVSTGAASVAAGMSVGGALSAGSISSGNVVSSGQVQSNGSPFLSLPSHNYNCTSGYVACWIDGNGTFGTSPSSALVKTGLTPMTGADAQRLLNLTPYWGRYVWDADTDPLRVFFLAEDVRAAGFGPDVAPVAETPVTFTGPDGNPVLDASGSPVTVPVGEAWTINYSQMVVPLIAAWHDGAQQMQAMQAQIDALTARLKAAGIP